MQIIAIKKVEKSKIETFNFINEEVTQFKQLLPLLNQYTTAPVHLSNGHKAYINVIKIDNVFRIDCDMPTEHEMVSETLDRLELQYIKVPSTNFDPADPKQSYKYHFVIHARDVAQDIEQYKWQAKEFLKDTGLDFLYDTRVTTVVTQQMNPYKDGKEPIIAEHYSIYKEGKKYNAKTPPLHLKYDPLRTVSSKQDSIEQMPGLKYSNSKKTRTNLKLDMKSGINTIYGYTDVGHIANSLKPSERIGGLSCPFHNLNHTQEHTTAGYGFMWKNEDGSAWVKCGGAACKDRAMQIDDPFHINGHEVVDSHILSLYIRNTYFSPSKQMYIWIDKHGVERKFKIKSANVFFEDCLIYPEDLDVVSLAEKFSLNYEKLTKDEVVFKAQQIILQKALCYIETRQADRSEAFTNPFKNLGLSSINTPVAYVNLSYQPQPLTILRKRNELVEDYKSYFPEFDDVLDFILSCRFTQQKTSYLWLQANSNWGKSMLFEGVFNEILNVTIDVNEEIIKKFISGAPMGTDATVFTKKWLMFIDEFKGAISELKNIDSTIDINVKHGSNTTVKTPAKIFTSAEEVLSLKSSVGTDDQFLNRFLYISPSKSNIDGRELFSRNRTAYKNALAYYINDRFISKVRSFNNMSELEEWSNTKMKELTSKYSLKKQSTTIETGIQDSLIDFGIFLNTIGGFVDKDLEACIVYDKDNNLYLKYAPKLKSYFIHKFYDKQEANQLSRSTPTKLFNLNSTTKEIKGRITQVYTADWLESTRNYRTGSFD